jgi:hypothetical protein
MPGLILPPSHVIHGKPPKFACTLCEAVFTEDERHQFEHHVLRGHDHAELREHSLQAQAPGIFDPHHESGDVAWQEWIDKNSAERPEDWRRWMKTGLDKT